MSNPIASVADLHARGKDLDLFYRHWDETCRRIKESKSRILLIAGDVWESPTIGDASSMVDDVLAAVIQPMIEHLADFDILAIPGNHDIAADGAKNALAALSALPNVIVAREPRFFSRPGIEIIAVPWSWSSDGKTAEEIAVSMTTGPRIERYRVLLAHGDIIGARMNKGKTCESVSWGFSRRFLEDLNVDRVVMGHFHARNVDLAGKGRGGYIGANHQHDHGEEENGQGFELWDPDTNEVKWVEVESYPRHRTIILGPSDPIPTPEPNLRVRTNGFILDAVQTKSIQDAGGKVEKVPEPKGERTRRADIPAGNLTDFRSLLDTYIATLSAVPVDRQLCYEELDGILTEKSADTEDEIEDEALQAAF